MKEMNSITVTTPMRTEVVGDRTVSHPAKIYKVVREGEKKPLKNLLKWCAALRSGEYEQGINSLRDADDKYCCLGVLCEVSGITPEISGFSDRWLYEGAMEVLPKSISDPSGLGHLGFIDCQITLPSGGLKRGDISLVMLNDGLRFSFGNIADVLELLYYDEQETSEQQ